LTLLTARIAWSGVPDYGFLVLNIILAWIPWVLATMAHDLHERGVRTAFVLLAFVPWLAFLPNAPYIVTDFIHLRYRDGAPLWFDALMLATFAWTGVGLGVASLRTCAAIVRARRGAMAARVFVLAAALLAGFGIYLGRFIRLNTWDVVVRPLTVLGKVMAPIAHPVANRYAWIVTASFALFFLVAFGVNARERLERVK
jgi:uncharacterized membrane protein